MASAVVLRHVAGAIVALLGSCKNDASSPPPTGGQPTPPTPVRTATADASVQSSPPPPAAGMLCGRTRDTWHWAPDGAVTTLDDSHIAAISEDGHAYRVEYATTGGRVVAIDQPTLTFQLPPDVPDEPSFLAIDSVSSALAVANGKAYVLGAEGTWSVRVLPAEAVLIADAIVQDGTWWIATGKAFMVDNGSAFEAVPTADKRPVDATGGFIRHGGKPFAVFRFVDHRGAGLYQSPVAGRSLGKSTRIAASTNRYGGQFQVMRGPNDGWAAWDSPSLVEALDGPPQVTARDMLGLVAIDAAKRIWIDTEAGMTAIELAGATQAYLRTSNALFAYDFDMYRKPAKCLPLDGGFATLPTAGQALSGTLSLSVLDAARAPFGVCGDVCTETNQIKGTLDDGGRWTGVVPIGTYRLNFVQVGGKTFVPDRRVSSEPGTAWFCEVKAAGGCSITGHIERGLTLK